MRNLSLAFPSESETQVWVYVAHHPSRRTWYAFHERAKAWSNPDQWHNSAHEYPAIFEASDAGYHILDGLTPCRARRILRDLGYNLTLPEECLK